MSTRKVNNETEEKEGHSNNNTPREHITNTLVEAKLSF